MNQKLEKEWNLIDELKNNIEKVIIGKTEVVELAMIALMSKGHLLIQDIPGVGKTTLGRAIAKSLETEFQRIQFTPDLLPSDILGVSIYNQNLGIFEFKKGPIFAHIVLADEINRATPRTQSALLEAMSDFQVTIDRNTYELPDPFMVIATQNPIEYEGTFPLPESQLDRFSMSITLGYLNVQMEKKMVLDQRTAHPIETLKSRLSITDVVRLQEKIRNVRVDDDLLDYMVRITSETRNSDKVRLGAGPRGSLVLYRTAQANAFIKHRNYCLPEDVKRVAVPVLAHRLILKPEIRYGGITAKEVVKEILDRISVPV